MLKKPYTYTFIAAPGGLLLGLDNAVINGAMLIFSMNLDK